MIIETISIRYRVRVWLDDETRIIVLRDQMGNWWGTDGEQVDAAELERQFREMMPDTIQVESKS